jgi:hypothetical protein
MVLTLKQFPIHLNFLEIPLILAQHVHEEGHTQYIIFSLMQHHKKTQVGSDHMDVEAR